MTAAVQPLEGPHRLLADFALCRANTESICARLEIEDHVVQPAPFVSPPKWHLAHTTWFLDCFLLDSGIAGTLDTAPPPPLRYGATNHRGDDGSSPFSMLFNSYYKSLGEHWLQERPANPAATSCQ